MKRVNLRYDVDTIVPSCRPLAHQLLGLPHTFSGNAHYVRYLSLSSDKICDLSNTCVPHSSAQSELTTLVYNAGRDANGTSLLEGLA